MMGTFSSWREEVESEATAIALSFISPTGPKDGPPTVYHYTSGEGLIGILKTRMLWASQATMLNDTREVRYGIELVEGMIQNRLRAAGTDSTEAMLLAAVGRVSVPQTRTFVSCFCDSGDDLGQWRGYGLTGGGYALGFERERDFDSITMPTETPGTCSASSTR